jgi:hypothetical protein
MAAAISAERLTKTYGKARRIDDLRSSLAATSATSASYVVLLAAMRD